MNLVDLGEPTSFLDHVYLGDALDVNANRTNVLLRNTKKDVRITNLCQSN